MFRVESTGGDAWAVNGPDNQTVFTGTLRECEDWLDQQENVQRLSRRTSWWARLWSFFGYSAKSNPASAESHSQSAAASNSIEESKSTPAA